MFFLMQSKSRIVRNWLFIFPLVLFCFFVKGCFIGYAEEAYDTLTDVSYYYGKTVNEVLKDFPDLWEEKDCFGTGKGFLTNGEVCFYYDYGSALLAGSINEQPIERIVLTYQCDENQIKYKIGDSLIVGLTEGDTGVCLNKMGYEKIIETQDRQSIWIDDEGHVISAKHGPFAYTCEIEYMEYGKDY